jgi:hypothetical protein
MDNDNDLYISQLADIFVDDFLCEANLGSFPGLVPAISSTAIMDIFTKYISHLCETYQASTDLEKLQQHDREKVSFRRYTRRSKVSKWLRTI